MTFININRFQEFIDDQQVIFVLQILDMQFHGLFSELAEDLFLWHILNILEGNKHFDEFVRLVPTCEISITFIVKMMESLQAIQFIQELLLSNITHSTS